MITPVDIHKIIEAETTTTTITKDKPNLVVFTVKIKESVWANVTNVTIDLSEIGGEKDTVMSNIFGERYRFAYSVPSQPEKGAINFIITVKDDIGSVVTGEIELMNIDLLFEGEVQVRQNYVRLPEGDPCPLILVKVKEAQSRVIIDIYDLEGIKVKNLVDGIFDEGVLAREWCLYSDRNEELPSGTYIVSVRVNNKGLALKKIILIR